MTNFILGVETSLIAFALIYCVTAWYKASLTSMYKAGYSKSQTEDTAQLLVACKLLPYEYGNIIWKTLTKTDLPEEKAESTGEKVIEGFKQSTVTKEA